MVVAALDGGCATTSWRSKRVAQRENKRATQGEATHQPAHLLPCRHYNMQRCHLSRRHGITRIVVFHATTAIHSVVIGHASMARGSIVFGLTTWGYAALSSATTLWR
jgi:hypothetical protein